MMEGPPVTPPQKKKRGGGSQGANNKTELINTPDVSILVVLVVLDSRISSSGIVFCLTLYSLSG